MFRPAFETLEKRELFSAGPPGGMQPLSISGHAAIDPIHTESISFNAALDDVKDGAIPDLAQADDANSASIAVGRGTANSTGRPVNRLTREAIFASSQRFKNSMLSDEAFPAASHQNLPGGESNAHAALNVDQAIVNAMVIMPDPGVVDVYIDGFRDAPKPDHKFGPWILASTGTDQINFGGNSAISFSDDQGDWYYFPEDGTLVGPFWWGTHDPKDPPEEPPEDPSPPDAPAPDPPDDGGGGGGGFWQWLGSLF